MNVYRYTFLLVLLGLSFSLQALSPEEIIRKMEANQVHNSARAKGRMITTDRFGTITRTFNSWSRGATDSLIEFTNIEEQGQKILRTADEIYLFFPDAEELIRLQGAALRDSVLDSDLSYEDMTRDGGLLNDYRVNLEGSEEIDNREHYVLRMEARRRNVPYQLQRIWVDKEIFVARRSHRYSRAERLLKEMEVTRIEQHQGKHVPTAFIISDKMKRNSRTEFILEELELDIALDPSIFSLQNLTW